MRRRMAALLATTMLLGCTADDPEQREAPSTAGEASAPLVVELAGDLEGRITLTPNPGGSVARETAEEVRRAWAAGELELPTVEYSSDDGDVVVLSWPRWEEQTDGGFVCRPVES